MKVASRAHRILKNLANYQDLTATSAVDSLGWIQGILHREGENWLGLYLNHPGSIEESVLVTDLGIYIHRSAQWEFVSYAQIESIESIKVTSEKSELNRLIIHLFGGQRSELPIRGGKGRFRDAFEFLHFLNRVIEDIRCKDK